MKKKIILALTACLLAAGTIINMHLAQNNHNMDVSLADISVMAQADGESGGGTTKMCMESGGYVSVWAYACIDPGYPTIPKYQCSDTRYLRTGKQLVQCW